MTERIQGILSPLLTTFDGNGELDQAGYLTSAGIHGVTVGGAARGQVPVCGGGGTQARRTGQARSPIRAPTEAEKAVTEGALAVSEAEPGEKSAAEGEGRGRERLVFYVDGASSGNPGPAGIGIVAFAEGRRVGTWQEPVGVTTNNEAEYLALKRALELALEQGVRQVEIRLDSELVYRQVQGEYRVRNRRLRALYEAVRGVAGRFELFEVRWVPREQNAEANRLARQAVRLAGRKSGRTGSQRGDCTC